MSLKNEPSFLSNKSPHQNLWCRDKPAIGISFGDPSGIGPEIIAKAIQDPKINKLGKIVVIGDKFVFSKVIRFKAKIKNCEFIDLKNIPKKSFSFGKISRIYGNASIEYLNCALDLIKKRKINCLVTAPISKEAINLAGYNYSGHTEYLKAKTKSKKVAMMFVADNLKVALVTRHLSLKDAIAKLSQEKILEAISLTADYLKKYFKIRNPRIGVCAINPHKGEGGLLGKEEIKIISPAIKKAKRKYKNVFGPIPSDIIFYQTLKNKFDAVIAMYHDQALIVIKTLFLSKAVNISLGLPFVRTSPSHGTAFDISGKNIADPSSMKEAIRLAAKLTRNITSLKR